MKTNLLITLVTLGLTAPAIAQFKTVNDGIAASPKVRQALEERHVSAKVAPETAAKSTVPKPCCPSAKIAASPKVKEMWPGAASQCCTMDSCMVASAR